MRCTWLATTIALLLINSSLALIIPQPPFLNPINGDCPEPVPERPNPVPGRNAACFTDGGTWRDQLFETLELAVSPKIPVVDEPILMYLWGHAPNVDGLDSAVLNITADWDTNQQEQPFTYELPLAETPWLRIREQYRDWTPGNVLKTGMNELLADFTIISIFTETGNYTFEFRVRLPEPDGRLLFGFEQTFYLKNVPW